MHSFAWWPTVGVLAVATFTDLRSRRIPNWLVLPFMAAGVVVSGWLHGWHGIGQSFAGLGLGLVIFGILFLKAGMGAGDVKLCAAIGAWIGPMQLFLALVMTGMAGGVMILCWAFWLLFLKRLLKGDFAFGGGKSEQQQDSQPVLADLLKQKMPYAPAIAVGTLVSFFSLPR